MIKKIGNQFVVFDHAGKKQLGKHATRAGALAQLRAIEINKKKKG